MEAPSVNPRNGPGGYALFLRLRGRICGREVLFEKVRTVIGKQWMAEGRSEEALAKHARAGRGRRIASYLFSVSGSVPSN
jgi:hypothetical protein